MKFPFSFFGKKSRALDQEIADASPKDIPPIEEERPVINWNDVAIVPMPGLELLPESVEERVDTFTAPLATQKPENPQFTQAESKDQVNDVFGAELAQEPMQESLIEPLAIEKVAVPQAESLKPLEIEDLLESEPLIIPAAIPDTDLESSPNVSRSSEPAVERDEAVDIPASLPAASISAPLLMDREDVIAAYKIFLNRLPESFEVIRSRVNSSAEANLIDFALADEFIRRSDLPAIIFPIAKKILETQEQGNPSSEVSSQP